MPFFLRTKTTLLHSYPFVNMEIGYDLFLIDSNEKWSNPCLINT